jgi:hypothetical protein
MSKIVQMFACYVLLLMALPGCKPGTLNVPSTGSAKSVKLYNCTHVNDANMPPSGRAYNIYTRENGSAWASKGGLNPQPGPWNDCHDAPHDAASLTIDISNPSGKWEIRAIKVPRADEPQCDSSAPDMPNACSFHTYIYQTDPSKGMATLDVTDAGQ